MIVRVRTKEKTHRIPAEQTIGEVYERMTEIRSGDAEFLLRLFPKGEYVGHDRRVSAFEDGVMFLLEEKAAERNGEPREVDTEDRAAPVEGRPCLHGKNEMCGKCLPLSPYDAEYLRENKIKHMSFYSYLRSRQDSMRAISCPLEEERLSLNMSCTRHAPYPRGLCQECRPKNITLCSQEFRMVDHVEFESPGLIDRFIEQWRGAGTQHVGYLYGRYEEYSGVPLGIKAVVCVIHVPLQQSRAHMTEIQQDARESIAEAVAGRLGMERVGVIFTDLHRSCGGKVRHRRGAGTYFLSGIEVVFAARRQLLHKFQTEFSPTGVFGSRFVTCVVSGNSDGEVCVQCYQISNIGAKMVEEGIVGATSRPGMMCVRRREHPMPEIFFREKGENGGVCLREVSSVFPSDYLLVSVSNGFSPDTSPFFSSPKVFSSFFVEGGNGLSAVHSYLGEVQATEDVFALFSSFEFLCYLETVGVLPDTERLRLAEAVRASDFGLFLECLSQPGFAAMMELSRECAPGLACRHCTYENTAGSVDCEMCGLPLGAE
ncbi:MAG: nuclear protein localization protein 4 [Amphiamblys sp. WSBS2006]|nr:MAG: nuclear protein localization protein 4 [Amphiamblys sp. WSBS2006]